MDNQSGFLKSLTVGSSFSPNLDILSRYTGLSLPEPLEKPETPAPIDYEAVTTDEHRTAARAWLVKARTSDVGYRAPDQQKRHLLRVPSRRNLKLNEQKWTFTKHEVGKAFQDLLSTSPLPDVQVAHAVLASAQNIGSLHELWEHFQDSKLQKRQSSIFHRSTFSNNGSTNWLDIVTNQGNIAYIHLMCQLGAEPNLLNQAFRIALVRRDIVSMKYLVGFGARVSSVDRDYVRTLVGKDDKDVIKLLLSTSMGMNVEDWQYCLEVNLERIPRQPDTLLQCVHHRPDIATGEYLLKAIEAKNVAAVAVLLAYLSTRTTMMPPMFSVHNFSAAYFLSTTGNGSEHEAIAIRACERVSRISEYDTRYKLYCLLDETNLLRDIPQLRQEMSSSVMAKRISMINLLVQAGVRPSLEKAVSTMDFTVLEIMLSSSTKTDNVPNLLSLVPHGTSEEDMLRFLNMFAAQDLQFGGQPLDQKLVESISKRHYRAVAAFSEMGANITYQSIHMVLDSADVLMLKILLEGDIKDDELSPALSDAMKIPDPGVRRVAVQMLADKNMSKQALLDQLRLTIQSPDPDLELIRIFLQYQLPLHGEEGRVNIFHLAIHSADLEVIQLLWKSSPHIASLSEAVTKAFSRIAEDDGSVTYNIIQFLLRSGARGDGPNKTLLMAAESNSPRAIPIIRLLVEHGADANHDEGDAYAAALNDYARLRILCKACPVKPAVVQKLLPSLLQASSGNIRTLELVLQSRVSDGSAIDFTKVPAFLKGHSNTTAIICCLIKHGLDINLQDGIMLRSAVEESNLALLKTLLSTNKAITTASLKAALKATGKTQPRKVKLDIMKLLLGKAGDTEIGQSEVLYDEILEALSESGDDRGVKILLAHNPVVDKRSLGIAAAFSSRSTALLKLLLSQRPSGESIAKACDAASRSPKLNQEQKKSVLGLLLDTTPGIAKKEMSNLLLSIVERSEDSTVLPQMLIRRGAEVTEGHLQAALTSSSMELFTLLVRQVEDDSVLNVCFGRAITSTMAAKRRLGVYQVLLDKRTISASAVSAALVIALKQGTTDVALAKMLLKHGADVKFKGFLPLKSALDVQCTEITELLIESIGDPNTAAAAFDLVRNSKSLKPTFRFNVYTSLLKHKITKQKLTQALVDTLNNGQDMDIMKLLLKRGADPSADGAKCLALACTAGSQPAFRVMCSYADVVTVTLALVEHCAKEEEVITWLKICMAESRKGHLKNSALLYKSMMKFPSGGALIEKLLLYGSSAGALTLAPLCKQWKDEQVTPLLWALMSNLKISNRILLALVAMGDDANPLYSTPISQVTAAFACILDPKRNPVLDSLLKLHGEDIKRSVVPRRSFSYLSQTPKTPDPTDLMTRDLPLSEAALYLGNLKAYVSLGCGRDADDGSLHTAALLALPEFVQWLLQWHSSNLELEAFGMMIPLVVVCRSKPRPWCRVANSEGTFEERRLKTMRVLAKNTDLSWRNRRKTVLHFAIDEGPDVLKAMLIALDVAKDPQRHERYLYTDREGIVYSLSFYISHLLDPDSKKLQSLKMIELLCGVGKLKDIMYRPEAPGPGVEQPKGYCGMPSNLQRQWDAYVAGKADGGKTSGRSTDNLDDIFNSAWT